MPTITPCLTANPAICRPSQGFTLVELMVAVALLAILLGLAVPSFQTTIARNRLSTQANELLSALQASRSEALRRNRTVRFCTTATNWQMTLQADGTLLKQGDLSPDATVGVLCADFRGDGLSYATNGALMTNGKLPVSVSADSKTVFIKMGSAHVE